MNNWTEIRKVAIVESDDTCDHWDRNGINFLFYWKSKFPKFKISLFTIPNRTSPMMLQLLKKHDDWIELLVHGFDHESNFECYGWDYDRAKRLMERVESFGAYAKIFKAAGWTITPDLCGYPSGPDQLIHNDKQGVYKAMKELDFTVVDRHYNAERRLEGGKYICIDDNPDIIHMHTWPMETGDKAGRNGYKQVIEEHGEPWDQNTEFFFMSEAIEKGMILPCRK